MLGNNVVRLGTRADHPARAMRALGGTGCEIWGVRYAGDDVVLLVAGDTLGLEVAVTRLDPEFRFNRPAEPARAA